MAIDRRVRRTRTLLYDALIELVRNKPYDQITIEDILRQADVGRSTFYAHFTSKDELLQRSLERLKALLTTALERKLHNPIPADGTHDQAPTRVLFEHVGQFKDVQAALAVGRGDALLREAVDAVLCGLLEKTVSNVIPHGFPRGLVIRQVVGTFHTVVAWWIEEQPTQSAAEVDAHFRRLLTLGLPEGSCNLFLNGGSSASHASSTLPIR